MRIASILLPPPSKTFGTIILATIALSYLIDGVVLGVLVPARRWFPQIVAALGIAITNEYFWPIGSQPLAILADTFATWLWTLAFVHAGVLAGNRIGGAAGYHPVVPASSGDYLAALMLAVAASGMKAILGRIIGAATP
jgi:hypothetical protein